MYLQSTAGAKDCRLGTLPGFKGHTLSLRTMANEANNFQELIAHCKEYGYIFQSSDLYDGLSAVYDYGQLGAQLKKLKRRVVEKHDANA